MTITLYTRLMLLSQRQIAGQDCFLSFAICLNSNGFSPRLDSHTPPFIRGASVPSKGLPCEDCVILLRDLALAQQGHRQIRADQDPSAAKHTCPVLGVADDCKCR